MKIDEIIEDALKKDEIKARPFNIPENMQTGQVEDDWIYWCPVDSLVKNIDLDELEKNIGVKLPISYRNFLKYKHFIDLYIGNLSFIPHPSEDWQSLILEEIYEGYPREYLIDKGFFPFSNYDDWSVWCFDTNSYDKNGECPVYMWDHENPDEFKFIAQDFISALLVALKEEEK